MRILLLEDYIFHRLSEVAHNLWRECPTLNIFDFPELKADFSDKMEGKYALENVQRFELPSVMPAFKKREFS